MANKNTLMLIDDSDIDAFINQKMIQNSGFADKIYIHKNASSAISFFKNFVRSVQLPKSLLPSIIFLDLNMPNQDGFGFVEEFNSLEKHITEETKIVFVSSSTNVDEINKAMAYENVIMFISKPLTIEHLNNLKSMIR